MDRRTGAKSWNTHALLTMAALRSFHDSELKKSVKVTGIGEFLSRAGRRFSSVIDEYNGWLALKSGVGAPKARHESGLGKENIFLNALRLNPSIKIENVRIVSPIELSPDTPHDPSRSGPPGGTYVPVSDGDTLAAIDIIRTFADEPDWGMDQDLFVMDEYGYGRAPFGNDTGPSSQAAFHMAFMHENSIAAAMIPDLRKSFMKERIQVFVELARIAFEIGMDYWGWRFGAWVIHYLQDLTQPYHAKAFPLPLSRIFRRLSFNRGVYEIIAEEGNRLKNHHYLFESIIHFLLNEAVKKSTDHVFFRALKGLGRVTEKPIASIMREASKVPASTAGAADRLMTGLIDDPKMDDPNYSLLADAEFRIQERVSEAFSSRPEIAEEFVGIVRDCLVETGKVTRYAVHTVARF